MNSDAVSALLRNALVDRLVADKELTDPAWERAFRAVPREIFIPRYFTYAATGGFSTVDSTDPEWLNTIYSDAVLPTQLDGDRDAWNRARRSGGLAEGVPTCSLSQPSLTAAMLEALHGADDHRVLEIGTGTGYHAALLCHRFADSRVTTLDLDPDLTRHATGALTRAGYAPWVLTIDGNLGSPDRAPFDRIIATCSFTAVPTAWLDQLSLDGAILTNVYRELTGGFLVRLTSTGDAATGHLLEVDGGYMPDRKYPTIGTRNLLRAAAADDDGPRRTTEIRLEPHATEPWHVLAELALPGTVTLEVIPADSGPVRWLLHPDHSWAVADLESGTVEQNGPRRLWDIAEQVHNAWVDLGQPARKRFGLTVQTSGKHSLWLDEPTNFIIPDLAAPMESAFLA